MCVHLALLVAVAEEAIVNIDIGIPRVLQSRRYYGIRLPLDQGVTNVHAVRVPRTPPHDRGFPLLRRGRPSGGNQQNQPYLSHRSFCYLQTNLHKNPRMISRSE